MPENATKSVDEVKHVRVRLPDHSEVEPQYSNGVVTNFSGTEFVITFFQAIAPPFVDATKIPDTVEAKILCRVVLSPDKWAEAVASFVKQLADIGTLAGPGRPTTDSADDKE